MKKINLFLILLLSFLLVFPPNVLAEVIGTISYIEGRVDRLGHEGDAYLPLVVGEEISPGDLIRTKSYSKAEITFKDDSIVRLGDSSQIRVKDYSIDENGYRETAVIDLDRGKVRAIVSETKEKAPFDINTPNASGSVKGSDICVTYQQSATNVMVTDGVFSMINPAFPDHKVDVGKDMATLVPYNAPPEEPKDLLPALKERLEDITGPSVRWAEGVSRKAEFTRAVITEISGAVRVQPRGSKKWHAPVAKEVLNTGDRIETGKTGRAQINFDNGLVMELKPETQLIIMKLTRDPKSRDFENVFESGYGKIIAKLKSVSKKSTFVVKTPHAVCGVRGTIMYLNILPNFTTAFFEGGSGFMKDTATGVTQIVKEGKTGNVDGAGNFSQSDTTDGDRAGFGSQFGNEGEGEYGYTSPDGDDVTYDLPVDPGTTGPTPPGVDQGTTPFDEVRPEVLIQKAQELGLTSVLGTLEGKYGYYGSFGEDPESSMEWAFLGLTSPAPWNGKHPAIIAGTYKNPKGHDLFFGEFEGIGDDGGRLFGYGVGADKPGNSEWEGVLAALFIDPSNVGGIMFSGGIDEDGQWAGLGGTYDKLAQGNMSGSGDTFYIPVSQLQIPPVLLDEAVIENSFEINSAFTMLDNDGYFNTESAIKYLRIPDEYLMDPDDPRFGVWEGIFSADYNSDGDDEWTAVHGYNIFDDAYLVTTLQGGDDLEGFLRMDLTASLLGNHMHGTYFGSIAGSYTTTTPIPAYGDDTIDLDSLYFKGVGAGGWIFEPLAFMSNVGNDLRRAYYYYNGEYYQSNNGVDPYSYYQYGFYSDKSSGYYHKYTYYNSYDGYPCMNEAEYGDFYSNGYYEIRRRDRNGVNFLYESGYWDTRHEDLSFLKAAPFEHDLVFHYSRFGLDRHGWLNGRLGSVGSLWNNQPVDALFMGTYDFDGECESGNDDAAINNRGYTWGTEIRSENYRDGNDTTYDGGAYYGLMGGYLRNPIEAAIRLLYIDPQGKAGYITGNATGETLPHLSEGNFFYATGTMQTHQMVPGIGVPPEEFGENPWGYMYHGSIGAGLSGVFLDDFGKEVGTIKGREMYEEDTTLSFRGQPWGIYDLFGLAGQYENSTAQWQWQANIGGEGEFGNIYIEDGDYYASGRGYWAGTIDNGTVEDDILRGDINGMFINPCMKGPITGEFLGVLNEDDLWQAVSLGEWQGDYLSYFSEFEGGFFSFHINPVEICDAFYDWHGYDWSDWQDLLLSVFNPGKFDAKMGGIGSLWSGSADSTIIGEYGGCDEDGIPRPNNIWMAPVYPYNGTDDSYTTYDGGSYYGFLVGSSRADGSADFLMRGLCVDESGNAGPIGGSYQGHVFPGAGEEGDGMFWVEGQLNTDMRLPGTGIAPGEFVDICQSGDWEGPVNRDTILCLGLDTDIDFLDTGFYEFNPLEDPFYVLFGGMIGQGISFNINNNNWGVWASAFVGAFAGGTPLPSWELPFTGVIVEGSLFDLIDYIRAWDFDLEEIEMIQAYMTGQVQGTEWIPNGRIAGNVTGFVISSEAPWGSPAGFNLVQVTGEVVGDNDEFVDIGEEFDCGTWQAAGAGEWVEVAELIDLVDLANQVEQMFDFVQISEIQQLQAADFSDFITGAQLDINLYANDPSLLSGVWAAMVNGTYDPLAEHGQDWFIDFTEESGSVDFHGVEWEDNQWSAGVTGELDGNLLAGTAAGTYADGNFNGAGAGVWVNEDLADTVVDVVDELVDGGAS